jgi:hypothetical protein
MQNNDTRSVLTKQRIEPKQTQMKMKTKNILKLAACSAAIMLAGTAQIKAGLLLSTNTVQDITVAFTLYSQGGITTNNQHSVITAVNTVTMKTKNLIGFLSTNTFKNPHLVLVVKNNGSTNPVDAYEIRDGTNTPVVVTNLSLTDTSVVKSSTIQTNEITTGVKYSLFTLSATNYAGTDTLSLSGFATTTHASIKVKDILLGVDSLTADVAGIYDTNGVFYSDVDGSVNIGGYSLSKIQ